MKIHNPIRLRALAALGLCAALAACGGSDPVDATAPVVTGAAGKVFPVCGPSYQKDALIAFFDAREGDTIDFCAGSFDFTSGLTMTGKRGITIKGAGKDLTFLRFKDSPDQDGVNLNRMTGIVIQGLTIYDAPGNGLRIFRCDFVTVRDVKVGWSISDPPPPLGGNPYGNYNADPTSWSNNGSYAFYPVLSHKILIEDSVSVGSSDAGVYVGQSSDILVRRTEAYHNVAGFEFENTYRAEFVDNIAHDNVGGFLVFDLPGPAQFGEKNLVHDNHSYNNNIPSFAPRGAIVGDVPSGTGMLVLASDQLEVYSNLVENNNTVGLAIVNYGLVDPSEPSTNYDFFPEGMHIYSNTFRDNAGSPQPPDNSRNGCKGDPNLPAGVPGINDLNQQPDCISNNASLLPTILEVKNFGSSAQIVWDGGVDTESSCDQVPVDHDGIPLDQPNPNEHDRYEARTDERGRPNLYLFDPKPACKYNKWKFTGGALNKPANGMCVENNTFERSAQNLLVPDFANVHFSTPDPTDPQNLTPADRVAPTDCPTIAPALLPQFVPVLGSFTPNPAADPRPTDAQIAAACGDGNAASINYNALAKFNCPRLDQYGLFADALDPRANPRGFGVPFTLNTALFSDYASKYRFLFLPPDAAGHPQKATYQDDGHCETVTIYDCHTATLAFPVGTVFAKTFSFKDGANEDVVETRLLIKRVNGGGVPYWIGMAYEWGDEGGTRVARLKIEGDTKAVTWDYDDADPAVLDANGNRQHYQGSAPAYGIPNAGACILCHGGDDREPGASPIGPKVRNLNRDNVYGGVTVNQLDYLQSQGLLDLPAGKTSADLEKLPRWNVPGSTGFAANSGEDVHRRVRSFLEVNCMHCHNPGGGAQNSGLSLDAADALDYTADGHTSNLASGQDEGHGICKPPTAAGAAADVGNYDIQAGNAAQSILPSRVASAQPGIRMPPVARTQVQAEAVNLIGQWVGNVVGSFADSNSNTCSGGVLPLPIQFMKVIDARQ
jgi:parallel beta-helix repeat protein